MTRSISTFPIALALIVGGIAGSFVLTSVLASKQLPDRPAPVVWNHETCAHCRMHVGEPAFATQLQTVTGDVLNFDDPGCAILYLEEREPRIHALYFHHLREDRWITQPEVAFLRVAVSPMGYGFGAVDAATAGAEPFAVLRSHVLGRNKQ